MTTKTMLTPELVRGFVPPAAGGRCDPVNGRFYPAGRAGAVKGAVDRWVRVRDAWTGRLAGQALAGAGPGQCLPVMAAAWAVVADGKPSLFRPEFGLVPLADVRLLTAVVAVAEVGDGRSRPGRLVGELNSYRLIHQAVVPDVRDDGDDSRDVVLTLDRGHKDRWVGDEPHADQLLRNAMRMQATAAIACDLWGQVVLAAALPASAVVAGVGDLENVIVPSADRLGGMGLAWAVPACHAALVGDVGVETPDGSARMVEDTPETDPAVRRVVGLDGVVPYAILPDADNAGWWVSGGVQPAAARCPETLPFQVAVGSDGPQTFDFGGRRVQAVLPNRLSAKGSY